jgi:retron-type reverse transcriptase
MMMELLKQHTQEKWVLMYVERWLKAGVEQEDGSITARTKGTPQGGVITPRTQLVTFIILLILPLF